VSVVGLLLLLYSPHLLLLLPDLHVLQLLHAHHGLLLTLRVLPSHLILVHLALKHPFVRLKQIVSKAFLLIHHLN
jgi:hypothetical protein